MTTKITFPAVKTELEPLRKRALTLVTQVEAQDKVNNLEDNWFGQCIIAGQKAMEGKAIASYEEAAKIVADDVEAFKTEVRALLTEREADAKKKYAGPDLAAELGKVTVLRSKVDNSLTSAKSVLRKAVLNGDTILRTLKDGGHILWRGDGTPRGKTELQGLIKAAKQSHVAPKSDFEKAMESGFTFAKRLASLDQSERQTVLEHFHKALASRLEDEEGEVEDEEPSTMAEAA